MSFYVGDRLVCRFGWNVEKFYRAWQATDGNMAHAGYVRLLTLTICNTYCFSTATMDARTHLIVTL